MQRRSALVTLGSGATYLTAGCLSRVRPSPEPVNLELWNNTENSHEVHVLIRDDNEESIFEDLYEIRDVSYGPPGGNVIREESITEATNDTLFDVIATLNQRVTREHRYRVQCSDEEIENLIRVEILSNRETYLEIDQSVCA